MKISKKWRQMSEVYIIFASGYTDLDFSETAASEMYQFETYGIGNLKQGLFNPNPEKPMNGFAVGKHWMDAQVKMWIQGLKEGIIFGFELYHPYPGETTFPHWWLDKVIPIQYKPKVEL